MKKHSIASKFAWTGIGLALYGAVAGVAGSPRRTSHPRTSQLTTSSVTSQPIEEGVIDAAPGSQVRKLVDQAWLLRSKGCSSKSLLLYRKALPLSKSRCDTSAIRISIARVLANRGNTPAAIRELDTVIVLAAKYTGPTDLDAVYGLTAVEIKLGLMTGKTHQTKSELLNRLIANSSGSKRALYRLSRAMNSYINGKPAAARTELAGLEKDYAGTGWQRQAQAFRMGLNAQPKLPKEVSQKSARAALDRADRMQRMIDEADLLSQKGDHKAAIALAKKALAIGTAQREPFLPAGYELARVYLAAGDLEQTVKQSDALLEECLIDQYSGAYYGVRAVQTKVKALAQLGHEPQDVVLRRLVESSDIRVRPVYQLTFGISLAGEGRKDQARQVFEEVAKTSPGTLWEQTARVRSDMLDGSH